MKSTRSSIQRWVVYLRLLSLLNLCLLVNSQVRPAVAACDMYKNWWPFRRKEWTGKEGSEEPGRFFQIVALGSLERSNDEIIINGTNYICSGTLISEKHVLTAAHCVRNIHEFSPIEAALMGKRTDLTEIESGEIERIPISKIVKHPEYRNGHNYHDIAVIELERPIIIGDRVRPACLMAEPLSSATRGQNISLTVLGWKSFDYEGKNLTRLLRAEDLELVERNQCSLSDGRIGAEIPCELDEGMLRVTDPDTERRFDLCQGSNLGPLFLNWEVFPKVVGVSSLHQVCNMDAPDIYTSVYEHLDWIEAQVWPAGVVPKTVGCWLLERKPGLMDYMKDLCIAYPSDTPCLCRCVNHLI